MKTLKEISVAKRDRDAVAEASRILKEQFSNEQVILFGSKARGDDDEESDIDLLLITTRPLSWDERDRITDLLFDVEIAHGVVISTLDVAVTDWTTGIFTLLPIYGEISKDGAIVA